MDETEISYVNTPKNVIAKKKRARSVGKITSSNAVGATNAAWKIHISHDCIFQTKDGRFKNEQRYNWSLWLSIAKAGQMKIALQNGCIISLLLQKHL